MIIGKADKSKSVPKVQAMIQGEWMYFNSMYHEQIPMNGRTYHGELKYVFSRNEEKGVQPMFLWSAEGIVKLLKKLGFKARLTPEEV